MYGNQNVQSALVEHHEGALRINFRNLGSKLADTGSKLTNVGTKLANYVGNLFTPEAPKVSARIHCICLRYCTWFHSNYSIWVIFLSIYLLT